MSTPQRMQPIGTLRIRRERNLTELSTRLKAETAEPVVTVITRYAPGFLLQVQVDAPALADVLKRFHEESPAKVKRNVRGLAPDAGAPAEVDRHASPGASYRAGDVVLCTGPDGEMTSSPQIAVFLTEVGSVQPEAPVIGRIDDFPALQQLADAVAKQPAADELLTTPVTTNLVVI